MDVFYAGNNSGTLMGVSQEHGGKAQYAGPLKGEGNLLDV
jgi:hypothetical protein